MKYNPNTEIAVVKAIVEARHNGQNTAAQDLAKVLVGMLDLPTAVVNEVTVSELKVATTQGKIEAIKRYRDRTRCGLKDAKDAIEAAVESLGLRFYVYPPLNSHFS